MASAKPSQNCMSRRRVPMVCNGLLFIEDKLVNKQTCFRCQQCIANRLLQDISQVPLEIQIGKTLARQLANM
jgi:hypothetical protein